jgi:glycosyltransferase involved in cell wall biosynthesis
VSYPEITVVIPTYNRAYLLKKAIESVLQQTFQSFEIIIIDDNSSDNTEQIVHQFSDQRIQYIRNAKNEGAAAARNIGILHASGKYIAFLDDDDLWTKDKLRSQLRGIDGYDVVLCGYISKSNNRIECFSKQILELNDLKYKFLSGGGTSIVMGKSSVLREVMFDEDLSCRQDWDLLVRLAKKYKIKYLKTPLVIYNNSGHDRISNEGIRLPVDRLEHRLGAFYKHREFLGGFWFNYRVAKTFLAFFKYRQNKLNHLFYTFKRCGIVPVLFYFCIRLYKGIK